MEKQEVSRLVQQQWGKLAHSLNKTDYSRHIWLVPLVRALRQHSRVSELFPYTSHHQLCLSRCTRYPFSYDCPHVEATAVGQYRVFGTNFTMVIESYKDYYGKEQRWKQAESEILGEGDIDEAVTWMDAALPPECGPAIYGDYDDLRRAEGKEVTAPAIKALHLASIKGNIAEVTALLETGADINGADYDGFTALMFAVVFGKAEMVHLLLERGADVHACTEDGETALSLAIFYDRHPEIVTLLRQAGAVV